MVAGLIHDIPTVKELIDRIMSEAEALIPGASRRWPGPTGAARRSVEARARDTLNRCGCVSWPSRSWRPCSAPLLYVVGCGSGGAMPSRPAPVPPIRARTMPHRRAPTTRRTRPRLSGARRFVDRAARRAGPHDVRERAVRWYALGDPVTDATPVVAGSSSADGGAGCDVLVGVVRDFKGINEPGGHPDFEAFDGKGVTPGLVGALLGMDQKPVYASHCEAAPDKTLCPYGQMTTARPRSTSGTAIPRA